MNRELLERELVRDEGKRLIAYRDSVGLWTIGIGHLLGKEERMIEITEAECHALFQADVDAAEMIARGVLLTYSTLDDVRQRVIVNMAFNLGRVRLGGFAKFFAALASGDWNEAGRQMMDSRWATQVGARANRLERMIRTGAAIPT